MKTNFKIAMTVLPILMTVATASSQTLGQLKAQYQAVSPIRYQHFDNNQVIAPDAVQATNEAAPETKATDEASNLDTDQKFFHSLTEPIQEDALDKAYKQDLVEQDQAILQSTNLVVKSEIKTAAPTPITTAEIADAEARKSLVMKKIAENARNVKACIADLKKNGLTFSGTAMTLAWDLTQTGKVEDAKIQKTDVASQQVQKCVLASLAKWDFAEAMKATTKRSRIQYTFRFKSDTTTSMASSTGDRTTASQN